jgi:hypothetical protein
MKKLLRLLAFVAAASVASAAQDRTSQPAPLVFGESAWCEVPVTASPGNPYTVPGGGGARRGVARNDPSRPAHVQRAVAQAMPRAFGGGRSSFPSWRAASVELTNAGAKEVKSVRLDFVFKDAPGGAEVLRLSLHARKRLRAGETKIVRKTVKGTATNRRGDGAHLSVEVREIVYTDGTAWRPSV